MSTMTHKSNKSPILISSMKLRGWSILQALKNKSYSRRISSIQVYRNLGSETAPRHNCPTSCHQAHMANKFSSLSQTLSRVHMGEVSRHQLAKSLALDQQAPPSIQSRTLNESPSLRPLKIELITNQSSLSFAKDARSVINLNRNSLAKNSFKAKGTMTVSLKKKIMNTSTRRYVSSLLTVG
jgi:hypothetical protein